MSNKLKIFVDAHVFDGVHQGTVTFISNLYSAVIKEDKYIVYVASCNKEKAIKLLKSNNFIHIKYKSNSKYIRLFFEIPLILIKYKINYAHFQYIAPIFKPCKYIITIHDLLFLDYPSLFPIKYRFKNYFLFYISSLRADIVTTVSSYSKNAILKNFKLIKKNIIVIPNIIDINFIDDEIVYDLNESKYLLYVSRIEPRKNHILLLNAWLDLELYNYSIKLVFVGHKTINDMKLFEKLSNLNNQQKQNFIWFENVNSKQLSWLYKNSSLFVFPSLAEGFGIPPLEASMYGAKVLVSNTTAMSDYFFFKHMFDPNDYEDFKTKLKFLLSNNYNIDKINNQIISIYGKENIINKFNKIFELTS